MWNFNPIKYNIYDCLIGLFVSYAQNKSINYEMGLLKLWGIRYDSQHHQKRIGEMIYSSPNGSFQETLRVFHGIECKWYNLESKYMLMDYVDNNLSKGPIIITFDTYNCPWCRIYRKFHYDHNLLITSISEHSYICLDSYFTSKKVNKLPLSMFNDWSGKAGVLTYKPVENLSGRAYIEEIKKSLDHNINQGLIKNLMNFENEIAEVELEKEFVGYENDIDEVPLFVKLKRFSDDRKCFALALSYIGMKVSLDLTATIEAFQNSARLYAQLLTIAIRQMYRKKYKPQNLAEIIHNIIIQEEHCIEGLSCVLMNYLNVKS